MDTYQRLVADRRKCHRCAPHLRNPSAIDDGAHDVDEVGHWSALIGERPADLLVVGRDWGDVGYLRANGGRDAPANRTNVALRRLLGLAGFGPRPGHRAGPRGAVFLTNAVLCIKSGGMSAPVAASCFRNCRPFLARTIAEVDPEFIVGLGRDAYDSLVELYAVRAPAFREAVEEGAATDLGGRWLFASVHPSHAHINRPGTTLDEDWLRIGRTIAALREGDRS